MPTKTADKAKKAPASAGKDAGKETGKAKASAGAKEAGKAPAGKKVNALQQPLKPSDELAAVVGQGPLPRAEVVSKVWDYIKTRNLQNPKDKREILADEALKKVFGKDKVTMFEMNKHLAAHLK